MTDRTGTALQGLSTRPCDGGAPGLACITPERRVVDVSGLSPSLGWARPRFTVCHGCCSKARVARHSVAGRCYVTAPYFTCMYVPPTLFFACLGLPPARLGPLNSSSTNCVPLLRPRGHVCLPLVHFACLGPILIKRKKRSWCLIALRSATGNSSFPHTRTHYERNPPRVSMDSLQALCSLFSLSFLPSGQQKNSPETLTDDYL